MKKLILKKISYKDLVLIKANARSVDNLNSEDSEQIKTNIEANGTIDTPLVVKPIGKNKYAIIQGQRRFLAFSSLRKQNKLSIDEILCLVGDFSDSEIKQMGINEAATTVLIPFRDLAQAIRELKAKDYPDYESKAFARIIGLSEELVEDSLNLEKQFEEFSENLSPVKIETRKLILRYFECPCCGKKVKHACRK